MSTIQNLSDQIKAYVDERNWGKYQKPRDLALSAAVELGELLEHFQWKTDEEIQKHIQDHREELGDEIADVFIYLIHLSRECGIDLYEATERKIEKVKTKYPAESINGIHTNKYS